MEISKCFLTENDCYKQQRYITPKGIMVHSTGANNPNLRRYVQPNDGVLGDNPNNNDWNRPNVKKCVHAFIGKDINGDVGIYQTLPWNMRGWHAGNGTSGRSANDTHISFEVCEDSLNDINYFNKIYDKIIELCTSLCKLYNLTADTVIDHSEGYRKGIASGHSDISHWLGKFGVSMDTVRADIAYRLKAEDTIDVDKAIDILNKADIITDIEYWTDASKVVKNLDYLLIKMASNIK